LRPLVPRRLEIDTFEGTAFIGIVPFAMEGVRFRGTPQALGMTFLETNVRTYVHVHGRDPGVSFFSLDAASLLAVVTARFTFGLPYFFASMEMQRTSRSVSYTVVRHAVPGIPPLRAAAQPGSAARARPPSLEVRYEVGAHLGPSAPGTLEHFLLERYLLHVERAGSLWTAQVHHPPYPAQRARVLEIRENLLVADGLSAPAGPPPIAHFAWGVDVEVFATWIRRHPPPLRGR
jgi:uncharacterized protein YqjF (DUF2071 family)